MDKSYLCVACVRVLPPLLCHDTRGLWWARVPLAGPDSTPALPPSPPLPWVRFLSAMSSCHPLGTVLHYPLMLGGRVVEEGMDPQIRPLLQPQAVLKKIIRSAELLVM